MLEYNLRPTLLCTDITPSLEEFKIQPLCLCMMYTTVLTASDLKTFSHVETYRHRNIQWLIQLTVLKQRNGKKKRMSLLEPFLHLLYISPSQTFVLFQAIFLQYEHLCLVDLEVFQRLGSLRMYSHHTVICLSKGRCSILMPSSTLAI